MYQRGKWYYISHRGKKITLKTSDKDEAMRRYNGARNEILESPFTEITKGRGRMGDYIEGFVSRYSVTATHNQYKAKLTEFVEAIGNPPVYKFEKSGTSVMRKYGTVIGRKNNKCTVAGKMTQAKTYLKYLMEEGILHQMPVVKKPTIPKKDSRSLSPEEVVRVLEEAKKHNLDFRFKLFLLTGFRISDVHNLKWSDILWDTKEIRKKIKKTNVVNKFPINRELYKLLQERRKDVGRVIPSGYLSIRYYICKVLHNSVGWGTPHTLRRTFASNLDKAGVRLAIIQQLMGHADLSTTMRYISRDEKGQRQAINGLSVEDKEA